MGAAGENQGGGEGAGAGGMQWFKCLNCTMEGGFFDPVYINRHKGNHKEERKKAMDNQAKQAAARKKEAAARGKPAKKGGKGSPAKKGGKGSRKSGANDKRCFK